MNKIIKYMAGDPNSPITLRALIDSRYARRIIGAAGNVHQYIQTTHEVKLYLNDANDRHGRLCSIAGPVTNVARAWREIICLTFNKVLQGSLNQNIWLKLLIPSELAIKLQQIPAKNLSGCRLNEIAASSKTRITIDPLPLAHTTEHVLEVSFSVSEKCLDNFTRALVMIGRQFQIHRHEALSPKNVYYTPFCYDKPPLINDEDEDEDDEDEDYYYYNNNRSNYNHRMSEVKNGKRPLKQQQQHAIVSPASSRYRDKGKGVLHPIAEISTSASALQQLRTLPLASSTAASSSSSSTCHLVPPTPEVVSMTVSPISIMQQYEKDSSSASNSSACQ